MRKRKRKKELKEKGKVVTKQNELRNKRGKERERKKNNRSIKR